VAGAAGRSRGRAGPSSIQTAHSLDYPPVSLASSGPITGAARENPECSSQLQMTRTGGLGARTLHDQKANCSNQRSEHDHDVLADIFELVKKSI
jgi:hypothetical protein